MPNPTEPRPAESMAVSQARAEGKIDVVITSINNLTEKVVDLRSEVTDHRVAIGALQSDMRQVKSDATEAAKAVIEAEVARKNTATAVEEADKKRVADAKSLVDQSAQKWSASPMMRISVVGGFLVALAGVVFGIIYALKTGGSV